MLLRRLIGLFVVYVLLPEQFCHKSFKGIFCFSTAHVQYVARHSTAEERRRNQIRDHLPAQRRHVQVQPKQQEITRVQGKAPSPRICRRLNNLHHPRIRFDPLQIHRSIWTMNSTSVLQTMHCRTRARCGSTSLCPSRVRNCPFEVFHLYILTPVFVQAWRDIRLFVMRIQ